MRGHVRQHNGRWAAVIYLGKEWDEKEKKYKKKYKWLYRDSQAEAERALTDTLYKLNNNQYIDPGKTTVSQFIDIWWPDYKESLAITTRDTYSIYIEKHIRPAIGYVYWRNLRPVHLSGIFTTMTRSGLTGGTQLYVYTILSRIFHGAIMYGLLQQANNPLDLVDRPKADVTEERKSWAPEYVNTCLSFVAGTPMESAILLAITTGMRRGEIAGLQWGDIDFDDDIIHIRHSYARTKAGLSLKDPKSKTSKKPVMLFPTVKDYLKSQRTQQKKNKVKLGAAYVKEVTLADQKTEKPVTIRNDFVHTWEDGTPIPPDYYSKTFRKVCAKIKRDIIAAAEKEKKEIDVDNAFPQIKLHELRHSLSSWAANANVPIPIVKDLLRHNDIKTTMRYVHPDVELYREQVQAIVDKVVNNSPQK